MKTPQIHLVLLYNIISQIECRLTDDQTKEE